MDTPCPSPRTNRTRRGRCAEQSGAAPAEGAGFVPSRAQWDALLAHFDRMTAQQGALIEMVLRSTSPGWHSASKAGCRARMARWALRLTCGVPLRCSRSATRRASGSRRWRWASSQMCASSRLRGCKVFGQSTPSTVTNFGQPRAIGMFRAGQHSSTLTVRTHAHTARAHRAEAI